MPNQPQQPRPRERCAVPHQPSVSPLKESKTRGQVCSKESKTRRTKNARRGTGGQGGCPRLLGGTSWITRARINLCATHVVSATVLEVCRDVPLKASSSSACGSSNSSSGSTRPSCHRQTRRLHRFPLHLRLSRSPRSWPPRPKTAQQGAEREAAGPLILVADQPNALARPTSKRSRAKPNPHVAVAA